uniref:Uncharacterized protein n=1 Tax=viral metagenome TaxID=1070528 RepID=A0A6C0AE06_9ZZZZ
MDTNYNFFADVLIMSFVYIFIIFTFIFFVYESLIIFSSEDFNEVKITLITFWVLVLIFVIILIFTTSYNKIWIPFYFILLIIVLIVLFFYSIIYKNTCILCTCIILIIWLSVITFVWLMDYFNEPNPHSSMNYFNNFKMQ